MSKEEIHRKTNHLHANIGPQNITFIKTLSNHAQIILMQS